MGGWVCPWQQVALGYRAVVPWDDCCPSDPLDKPHYQCWALLVSVPSFLERGRANGHFLRWGHSLPLPGSLLPMGDSATCWRTGSCTLHPAPWAVCGPFRGDGRAGSPRRRNGLLLPSEH